MTYHLLCQENPSLLLVVRKIMQSWLGCWYGGGPEIHEESNQYEDRMERQWNQSKMKQISNDFGKLYLVPDMGSYGYSVADASDGVCCAIVFVDSNQITVNTTLIASSQVSSDLLLSIAHGLGQNNGIYKAIVRCKNQGTPKFTFRLSDLWFQPFPTNRGYKISKACLQQATKLWEGYLLR